MAARGYQGAMLRALGVDDHAITVVGVEDPAPGYRRVRFEAPTLFDGETPAPAAWLRIWFPDPGDADHEVQRAFTFVDADADAGTFALDFVLHQPAGPASAWAGRATVGDELRATPWASTSFTPPAIPPAGYLLLGDLAGLPGLRAVVGAIPDDTPIELLLEEHHATDRAAPLPTHPNLRITWVPHRPDGRALAEAVPTRDWSDWYAWAAAEKGAIKALKEVLRGEHGFPKTDLKLAPYWIEGKPMGGKARSAPTTVEVVPAAGAEATDADEAAAATTEAAPTFAPAEPTLAPADGTVATPGPAAAPVVPTAAPVETAPTAEPTVTEVVAATAATAPTAASAEGEGAAAEGAPPAPTARRWRSQAGSELLAPLRGTLRVAGACQALLSLLQVAPFVILVDVARRMLDGAEPDDLRTPVFVALSLLGAATVLTAALVTWLHVVDARFARYVRRRLVDKLTRLPLGWFDDTNAGSVRQLVVDDTAGLHYLVTHARLDLVAAIVKPLAVLVYLFVVDARLALVLLVPILIHAVVVARMATSSKAKMAEHARWNRRVAAETVAALDGAAVDRIYGRGDDLGLRRTLRGYTAFINGWQGPLGTRKAVSAMITRPTTMLWLIATVGTALVTADTLGATTLLTFLVLGVTFGPELLGVSYAVASYRESSGSAQRVGLALALDELDVPEAPERFEPDGSSGLDVSFRGVTFGYRPNRPVVHDVDLDLAPGTITALVGPSGSGKSTLATLLARFHDVDRGTIALAGHDLRALDPADLRRLVGFVFQDVRLVHGTVRENLALARPDADDAELLAAAEAANIADRLAALPRGLDTVVGTEVRLSGGEAQRIAIARTLLADPPVLVLDEATAFADPESEHRVQQALSELVRGRTVLVIAHRLHTVVDADQIVVLDEGRIVERGTHPDLLAAGGRYAALWSASHPEEVAS